MDKMDINFLKMSIAMDPDSSEDEYNELGKEPCQFGLSKDNENSKGPWQCGLSNVSERVIALLQNGSFTDITLTFPDTEITYDVHRLILAMTSTVFEGILYGPMGTEGPNVLLHDDDPVAMKHVLAYCYGHKLHLPDMDTTLEVYKLADKYLLNGLKKCCCEHIVNHMSSDNNNDVIVFAERYNFTDLKSDCLALIQDKYRASVMKYASDEFHKDEPHNRRAYEMLIELSDAWIEGLLSKVRYFQVLDFQESWKYPVRPLEDNRLRTILSCTGSDLQKFYGCINAELIYQLPLEPGPVLKESLKLCLSVTDPHHAKRVIDVINQQNRFKNNVIAIHIRCEEVWPSDWFPIRPERTHRPSLLVISDTDDDKAPWVVEATKALLPQCEGPDIRLLRNFDGIICRLKQANILVLPRSNFTPNGFINMMQELSSSGVKCFMIVLQSPHISDDHKERINGFIQALEHTGFNVIIAHDDDNICTNVYKYIPVSYFGE